MVARPKRLAAALLAAFVSLAATGYSQTVTTTWQIARTRLPSSAAVPLQLQQALGKALPAPSRAAPGERQQLISAIRATPLDQRLLNGDYVQRSIGRAFTDPALVREARVLARLGWRNSPTTANLLVRYATDNDALALVDRADTLLRRQSMTDLAQQMMGAIEITPAFSGMVVKRLQAGVPWRSTYLAAQPFGGTPAFLMGRLATFRTLARTEGGLKRNEVASFVTLLGESGRVPAAYELWRQVRSSEGTIVPADPSFVNAHTLSSTDRKPTPFEWQMTIMPGYSATPLGGAAGGATLQWDGRGVPTLMRQTIRVEPGRRYALTVESGQADEFRSHFAPTLLCGTSALVFQAASANAAGMARYVSDPVPQGCSFASFEVDGRVTDMGATSVDISRISLRPI